MHSPNEKSFCRLASGSAYFWQSIDLCCELSQKIQGRAWRLVVTRLVMA